MRGAGLIAALTLIAGCGASQTDALVLSDQIEGDRINTPLTAQAGNVTRGAMLFSDRASGHCVLCHGIAALDVPFQGNIGPDLSTVGDRLDAAQLRLRIVDYQIVNPNALMPSYYRIHDLYQVAEPYADAPILTAQQVEDLVAYLSAQKAEYDDA
jgi:L-cysteine S-thiosulfotransferase